MATFTSYTTATVEIRGWPTDTTSGAAPGCGACNCPTGECWRDRRRARERRPGVVVLLKNRKAPTAAALALEAEVWALEAAAALEAVKARHAPAEHPGAPGVPAPCPKPPRARRGGPWPRAPCLAAGIPRRHDRDPLPDPGV